MNERWIPILAGVIGVVGGVGGAVAGGVIANEGQQDQFDRNRAEELRDLREQAYVRFIGAAETVLLVGGREAPEQEADAREARAEILLLSPNLQEPADELLEAAKGLKNTDPVKEQERANNAYNTALTSFIVHAQDEVGIEP